MMDEAYIGRPAYARAGAMIKKLVKELPPGRGDEIIEEVMGAPRVIDLTPYDSPTYVPGMRARR